jgi:hypothetical protein
MKKESSLSGEKQIGFSAPSKTHEESAIRKIKPASKALPRVSTCFNTPTIYSIEKRFLLTANPPSSGQILPETNSTCMVRIGGPITLQAFG